MFKQVIELELFQIYKFPSNKFENFCVSLKKMSGEGGLKFISK
jgi:hypothetical protein